MPPYQGWFRDFWATGDKLEFSKEFLKNYSGKIHIYSMTSYWVGGCVVEIYAYRKYDWGWGGDSAQKTLN
jgi:hypothetical protein